MKDVEGLLNSFHNLLKDVGIITTILIFFVLGLAYLSYKLIMHIINNQQKQIDSLALENHKYRDYFISIQDKKYGYEIDEGDTK